MDLYLKACAAVLLTLVLILALGNKGKEFSVLLAILVCCMMAMVALRYLQPVIEFMVRLVSMGGLDPGMLDILLKICGIGIISEIAVLICSDAGNASLGKTIQLLGSAVMLWLSIPVFTMLLELIENVLGGI